MYLSGPQEMEVGGFRNLPWLCIPYMLVKAGSSVRHEEMDWERMHQTRTPPFALFNGVCSVLDTVCFKSSGLQQDKIPVETE